MVWEFSTYKHAGFNELLYLRAKYAVPQTETIDARWIEQELCFNTNELKNIAEQWGFSIETNDYMGHTFYIIFGFDCAETKVKATKFIDQVLIPKATMNAIVKGE